MDFWDTRRGWELADTLIRHLPRLTHKEQFVVRSENISQEIEKEIHNGNKFVSMIDKNSAVMEKPY